MTISESRITLLFRLPCLRVERLTEYIPSSSGASLNGVNNSTYASGSWKLLNLDGKRKITRTCTA